MADGACSRAGPSWTQGQERSPLPVGSSGAAFHEGCTECSARASSPAWWGPQERGLPFWEGTFLCSVSETAGGQFLRGFLDHRGKNVAVQTVKELAVPEATLDQKRSAGLFREGSCGARRCDLDLTSSHRTLNPRFAERAIGPEVSHLVGGSWT